MAHCSWLNKHTPNLITQLLADIVRASYSQDNELKDSLCRDLGKAWLRPLTVKQSRSAVRHEGFTPSVCVRVCVWEETMCRVAASHKPTYSPLRDKTYNCPREAQSDIDKYLQDACSVHVRVLQIPIRWSQIRCVLTSFSNAFSIMSCWVSATPLSFIHRNMPADGACHSAASTNKQTNKKKESVWPSWFSGLFCFTAANLCNKL